MISWQISDFKHLTTTAFYDLAYERTRTFVVAQHRVYQEIDAIDQVARHILGYQEGHLVAYARVFHEHDHATFGRVLTVPEVRGQGVGRLLMQQITTELDRDFAGQPVVIEAQVDKQGFYEKFDYAAEGRPFLFNHTPHIKMVRRA
ncbi:GNAT family N-acetyltransferase [Levilactobacillus zymae]|uniref:GNAT family N-acetyltransferase n=1 Tax=Levilactobacillus zymae TaxID=267363 RepID=UPI0028B70D11|nr:GNAT family N-acetyltransferase [Levilactobacillus zymae]MDT6979278.1 GNAT family N-acetyltransferase [Levilactobacillus zymae]